MDYPTQTRLLSNLKQLNRGMQPICIIAKSGIKMYVLLVMLDIDTLRSNERVE